MSISTGTIEFCKDSGKLQYAQVSGRAGFAADNCEVYQTYGLTSQPLPGAECVLIPMGGYSSRTLAVKVDDRRYRPRTSGAGDVALYTHLDSPSATHASAAHRIALDCSAGRKIILRTSGGQTAEITMTDAGTIDLTAGDAHISLSPTGITCTFANKAIVELNDKVTKYEFDGSQIFLTANGMVTNVKKAWSFVGPGGTGGVYSAPMTDEAAAALI